MKKSIYIIWLIISALLLGSCEFLSTDRLTEDSSDHGMHITALEFDNNYRDIVIKANVDTDLGDICLDDTSKVRIKLKDTRHGMISGCFTHRPVLTRVENIGVDEIARSGLVLTVLVDLTQPTAVIVRQRQIIQKIARVFCRNNLLVSFMLPSGEMTNLMQATPYVINNYIVPGSILLGDKSESEDGLLTDSVSPKPFLYRTVYSLLDEVITPSDPILRASKYKAVLILSDGVVYDYVDNMPLDPNHFKMQEKLIAMCRRVKRDVGVYYVSLKQEGDVVDETVTDDNMMRMVCEQSGGKFYDSFDWHILQENILKYFNVEVNEYCMHFDNPRHRVYFGNKRDMKVMVLNDNDSLMLSAVKSYSVGSVWTPVVVDGVETWRYTLVQGVVLILLMTLFVYLVLQLLYPFVRYMMFRRKSVMEYTGANMCVNGRQVPGTCYYCKAPFVMGDSIVAACEHVMHEECWVENDNHCPEYGTHCHMGSHFYDRKNVFNPANAPFCLKWILMAMGVALISWVMVIYLGATGIISAFDYVIKNYAADPELVAAEGDKFLGTHVVSSQVYSIAMIMYYPVPMLTFAIAFMVGHHRSIGLRVAELFVRAALAFLLSCAGYLLEIFVMSPFGIYDADVFFDWIPLSISIFTVCFVSTFRTRVCVRLKRYILTSLCFGIVCSVLVILVGTIESLEYTWVFIMFHFVCVSGVLYAVAQPVPRGDHYTLHVSGAIKDMDIALYKWLRQDPGVAVTMGRSVDCSLQMTWDLQTQIAPVHACIRLKGKRPYLQAYYDGVLFNRKPLAVDRFVPLYHGDEFMIGNTRFRYLDR